MVIKVAVDAIILEKSEKVILIKRNKHPFKGYFCLPGGFVEEGETLHHAISREVKEETGIKINFTKRDYFTYFDDPKRDPRGRVITHVFVKILERVTIPSFFDKKEICEVRLFDVNNLPQHLGFDHACILHTFLSSNYLGDIFRKNCDS